MLLRDFIWTQELEFLKEWWENHFASFTHDGVTWKHIKYDGVTWKHI